MERITSSDLPQADRIESVILTVLAVANGKRTDIDIANEIPSIAGDDRQGRYYRRAAIMLGFVENRSNNATLTLKGESLINNPTISNPLFISSVLNLKIYQKLIPYLEMHRNGISRGEILSYLNSIADPTMGVSMLPRRISTILAWPIALGFITKEASTYTLINRLTSQLPYIEIVDSNQPLLPTNDILTEYQDIEARSSNANRSIQIFKDQAKLERANAAHSTLVNLVANQLREIGQIPKSNKFIDLAVRIDQDYIFEMKSTTETNAKSQIRKGVSQLYEYQYLQNLDDANLVLVIENPLYEDVRWMENYLENKRNINLIWDGDGNLYGSERTKEKLNFLSFSA